MFGNLRPYVLDEPVRAIAHGLLPAGWVERRLGTIGAFTASGIDKKLIDGEPQVRIVNYLDVFRNPSHALTRRREYMSVTCPAWKRAAHQVKRGDLIFTPSSETADEIGRSAVALEDLDNTAYSYHVLRFRPTARIDADFARFWCNHTAFYDQLAAASTGTTRKILGRGDFRNVLVVVPPYEDQRAIAKYLGHAHMRIDRAIAAKRKLIALLEEQKQAIILQAVTRGLDPTVPLKDSGIPWLGDIPAHWQGVRLKALLSSGPNNGVSPPITEDGDLATFSLAAVRDGVVSVKASSIKYVARSSVPRHADFELCKGDVVLVRGNGNVNLVGRAALVESDLPDSIYPDLIIRIRLTETANPAFVVLALNSRPVRTQIEVAARTAVGTFKINAETLKSLCLGLPPLADQSAIVNGLGVSTASLATAIATATREVTLLREFRTRLTSDVVTGQVDVREIAASLPELTDDLLADTSDDAEDSLGDIAEESIEGAED